jgi:hypothetical protein
LREILKVVMPHDQSRRFMAHPHARHARVTIRIDKVNVSGNENVLIIRAARCQDQRAEKRDFNCAQDYANHGSIPSPQSTIRNPKF